MLKYIRLRLLKLIFVAYNIKHMNNGTVKFFNDSKGFGFITPDEGNKDVFVHLNGLKDEIRDGDKVTYEVEDTVTNETFNGSSTIN